VFQRTHIILRLLPSFQSDIQWGSVVLLLLLVLLLVPAPALPRWPVPQQWQALPRAATEAQFQGAS
jgi:hypothetical protein